VRKATKCNAHYVYEKNKQTKCWRCGQYINLSVGRRSAIIFFFGLMASAVPHNLSVVKRLNGTAVATAISESGVLLEDVLDDFELLTGDTKRALHDVVLNTLRAWRGGQTALVSVVLAVERLLQLPEIDSSLDLSALVLHSWGPVPVDVVQEPVGETTFGLQVEKNGDKHEIVQTHRTFLLVHNVEFHLIVTILLRSSVNGVLRRSMEVELLNMVFVTIARVTTTNSHVAQISLDLESVSVVNHGEIQFMSVVEVNSVFTSFFGTVAHAFSLGILNINWALSQTSLAHTRPVFTTTCIGERGRGRSCSGGRSGSRSSGASRSGRSWRCLCSGLDSSVASHS